MAKVSNTTDNRNGRVHSRHIDPIVQKIPYTNLENVQARGFSAAARNFQERGKTSNLPKDEAKEGTGQRLLNVSRGLAGGGCPLPDHLKAREGQRGSVQAGGREGNLL